MRPRRCDRSDWIFPIIGLRPDPVPRPKPSRRSRSPKPECASETPLGIGTESTSSIQTGRPTITFQTIDSDPNDGLRYVRFGRELSLQKVRKGLENSCAGGLLGSSSVRPVGISDSADFIRSILEDDMATFSRSPFTRSQGLLVSAGAAALGGAALATLLAGNIVTLAGAGATAAGHIAAIRRTRIFRSATRRPQPACRT